MFLCLFLTILRLLDVAPWGSTTDPLLFDWNELRDKAWELVKDCDDEIMIEFRYVKPEMIGKLVNQEAYQRFPQVQRSSEEINFIGLIAGCFGCFQWERFQHRES